MDKKRLYSILYLVCIVLLINSNPFSLFISNEILLLSINLVIKVISIIYILHYIKKENLNKIKTKKLEKSSIKLIPLLLLCFSNFFVVLIANSTVKTEIDIFAILSGLVIAILIGIIEELLFRNQILEELLKNQTKFKALLYSSLIFGGVHLLNISSISSIPTVLAQVGYTFILGLCLGYIYISSKNIILPIIYHTLFNFLNDVLVVKLFNLKWDLTFFIVNISLGILVIIYLFLTTLKKKGANKNASEHLVNW